MNRPSSLTIRSRQPDNLESSFHDLSDLITPNENFYVRSHFETPEIDVNAWTLQIGGSVREPLTFTLAQLEAFPRTSATVTLECAGNGRVYLSPAAPGDQWALGAVGTADWTGVRLSTLLQHAGVDDRAKEVILVGSDVGVWKDPPKPVDQIQYARSIPIKKAMSGDVLLAYQMNEDPLPASHGSPVRAVVGGWYGMASVKWLSQIIVVDQPFQGYFQTTDYAYWSSEAGMTVRRPITEMQLKLQIARPTEREVIAAGSTYRVTGAAWSGSSAVARVEFSDDGGRTFAPASLTGAPIPFAWRLWDFQWKVPKAAGMRTLAARAFDETGRVQTTGHDPNFGNYMISHQLPVVVEVR